MSKTVKTSKIPDSLPGWAGVARHITDAITKEDCVIPTSAIVVHLYKKSSFDFFIVKHDKRVSAVSRLQGRIARRLGMHLFARFAECVIPKHVAMALVDKHCERLKVRRDERRDAIVARIKELQDELSSMDSARKADLAELDKQALNAKNKIKKARSVIAKQEYIKGVRIVDEANSKCMAYGPVQQSTKWSRNG